MYSACIDYQHAYLLPILLYSKESTCYMHSLLAKCAAGDAAVNAPFLPLFLFLTDP